MIGVRADIDFVYSTGPTKAQMFSLYALFTTRNGAAIDLSLL